MFEAKGILKVGAFSFFHACTNLFKRGISIGLSYPASGMEHGNIYKSHGVVYILSGGLYCCCNAL